MPRDPIHGQGQGHWVPKFAKMADFKVCLLRQYARNQKTNGWQYLNFSGQIFEIRPRSVSRDLRTSAILEISNADFNFMLDSRT